jgi:hypothetical protein
VKCEVTFVSSCRPTQHPSGRPWTCWTTNSSVLTCLLHTPALLVLLHACTTVQVSQLSSIYHTPAHPSPHTPLEPSRSLSTRNLALINSVIALFNRTAEISGTTVQDDSGRLGQSSTAYSPGPSLSVINRAGLAVLADRLSQSRSQLRGRSPLLTRILLSIPARPDC